MTADEKYDKRIELCRTLRAIETEIENIDDIACKWNESKGNEKGNFINLYRW